MNTLAKYVLSKTYKPLLQQYLSGTRKYSCERLMVEVPPGVFHPGFFYSTKLLLNQLKQTNLQGKTFLDLGAGSGLIALYAAKNNAKVLATDINPAAVKAIEKNKKINRQEFEVMYSDLFNDIPPQTFDIIAINPPYYKKDPQTPADYAWYCGANGEYFKRLFQQLGNYIHEQSLVLMVLCESCDKDLIDKAAARGQFSLHSVFSKTNWLEQNFIYQVKKMNEAG